MKYYLIAGEASGDLHGANLLSELKKKDSKAEFRYWGGDLMNAQGGTLIRHYKHHNFMGFVEVIKNIKTILNNIKFCKEDIKQYAPDAVIFIDFPGFNLRIVEYVKSLGIKTFYYISPTVWAWKEKRAVTVKKFVDHMFVVLPFVKDFYKNKYDYEVDYVGHPLVDSINQSPCKCSYREFVEKNSLSAKKIIAVLPGSRGHEIAENLKVMQEFAEEYTDYQFVIAGMSVFDREYYEKRITAKNVSVVFDQTYDLLYLSEAAIVVSGSATLETAIIGTPEMLVYKTNPITYVVARIAVGRRLKFLGLPNLIMNRMIIPEFLQMDMTAKNINKTLKELLYNETVREKMLTDFKSLRDVLGSGGASKNVAELIWKYLN